MLQFNKINRVLPPGNPTSVLLAVTPHSLPFKTHSLNPAQS